MVVTMERWEGKVAIVTGASAGIGAAIVEALVAAGLKVVGLARRKEKVEELATKLQGKTGKLYPIKADVTREEDLLEAFKWIQKNLGPVHILVNNAGIGKQASLLEGETESWRKILETNVLALSIATREAVNDMRANNVDGHIIHMNSILGHQVAPIPNLNLYPASKFAVTALTETLRQELKSIGSKIKITSISPGMVATDIWEVSGFLSSKEQVEAFEKSPQLSPEDVADAVIYVLSTPPNVQIHEMVMKPVGEVF